MLKSQPDALKNAAAFNVQGKGEKLDMSPFDAMASVLEELNYWQRNILTDRWFYLDGPRPCYISYDRTSAINANSRSGAASAAGSPAVSSSAVSPEKGSLNSNVAEDKENAESTAKESDGRKEVIVPPTGSASWRPNKKAVCAAIIHSEKFVICVALSCTKTRCSSKGRNTENKLKRNVIEKQKEMYVDTRTISSRNFLHKIR
jgi:hypothetical protein